MKQGLSLSEWAAEVERQAQAKRDFVVDTRQAELVPAGNGEGPVALQMNGLDDQLPIRALAHRQIGQRVGIPAKYYDRMLDQAPELLTRNVNHWFQEKPEKRLVRVLDGKARAFLSDRYRRIDNVEVAEAVVPVLQGIPGIRNISQAITESRLYLKVVTTDLQAAVKVGDIVQAGLSIKNSEVGLGSLLVEPMLYRLACLNGMIVGVGMKKYHVGRSTGQGIENATELFSDTTKVLDDKAFLSKLADVVRGVLDQDRFQALVNKFRNADDDKITGDPVASIEELGQRYRLTEGERHGVLRSLVEGGDGLSRFGVINAVTAFSQTVDSYDRATELEELGGKILDLPKKDWSVIATAESKAA